MTRKKAMTTAPLTAASTTAGGRLKLPKLDKDGITARARAEVIQTLDSIEDDTRRLEQATAIIDQATGFLADNEPRMKKMALYLALIEGAVAVSDSTSMSRYAFYKLTEKVLGDPVEVQEVKPSGKTVTTIKYVWAERPASWDETVAARAKDRGVRIHRNAATELPPLAEKVTEHHVHRDVARSYRDSLILKLVESGMNHGDVATLIGRERSRVTQIVSAKAAKTA